MATGKLEDIRFTDPFIPKEEHSLVDKEHSQTQFVQQQENLASLLHVRQDRVSSVQASQDHLAMALGESSQAQAFVETGNIQARNPTSSTVEVRGQEISLKASCCALPTTYDKSLRNKVPVTQDDVEMEAFYASLEAGTNVLSHPYEKSATTALSEEARKALKIVLDFVSNDASVLLHSEQCSIMKTNLDYLSNLSIDDGISEEMKTLISEALWFFTHWSRGYIDASMKINSTASELKRADELQASLEANRNQFKDVVALENELLQKLASMEKSKKELEEQINAIKANLSACELEKKMTIQRKRDIFVEGKTLKAQIDELREKVPRVQHEQGLAKETQAKIASIWSKLGEKFKTIAIN